MACPKLPAEAHTMVSLGSRERAKKSEPRPLKLRIGLAVSILTRTRRPSAALSVPSSYCGLLRNTGSINCAAFSMLARLKALVGTVISKEKVRHQCGQCRDTFLTTVACA